MVIYAWEHPPGGSKVCLLGPDNRRHGTRESGRSHGSTDEAPRKLRRSPRTRFVFRDWLAEGSLNTVGRHCRCLKFGGCKRCQTLVNSHMRPSQQRPAFVAGRWPLVLTGGRWRQVPQVWCLLQQHQDSTRKALGRSHSPAGLRTNCCDSCWCAPLAAARYAGLDKRPVEKRLPNPSASTSH